MKLQDVLNAQNALMSRNVKPLYLILTNDRSFKELKSDVVFVQSHTFDSPGKAPKLSKEQSAIVKGATYRGKIAETYIFTK